MKIKATGIVEYIRVTFDHRNSSECRPFRKEDEFYKSNKKKAKNMLKILKILRRAS